MAASSFNLFLISIVVFLSLSHASARENFKPKGFIFPIRKNTSSLHYTIATTMGDLRQNFYDVAIDLGGQYLWLGCESNNYTSSTYRPVRCGSSKCKAAKGSGCVGCNSSPRPGCTNNTCGIFAYNPIKDLLYSAGLGEDSTRVATTNGYYYSIEAEAPKFAFSCVDSGLLEGLTSTLGGVGIVGLAKTQTSLHKQLSTAFKLPHKFALCLPRTTENGLGDLFISGGPYYMPPYPEDVSKLFLTTPLIINPVSTAPVYTEGDPSDEYFIDIKSIKIDGKIIPLNASLLAIDKDGVGGTKLSTMSPYTVLHTSIYRAITNEFANKASSMKITRVASVKPFGACFNSKTIASSKTGPAVPNIDLGFHNKKVYWRIYGHNSMVKVKKNIMCLGFIDGGSKTRTSIVLGGFQLEDNLIQFDLVSSKLGFSNSLLLLNTSCSQSRLF